ncbi:unnamed protein product, partial [Rotaria sp. Silwood2]
QGVNLSLRTVQHRLVEAEFKYSRPLSKPLLSQQHQHNRLTWAQPMTSYDWNKIILIDETTIRLNSIRKYFWPRPGFGRIVFFHHNLNSRFLCNEIYKNALLPTARIHFGRRRDWVVVLDKEPKHRSSISIEWKQHHHVTTLPWPSHSPDVNPIENLWSLLKIKIASQKPKTIMDLKRAIYKEWNDLPTDLAPKLVWTMKNR